MNAYAGHNVQKVSGSEGDLKILRIRMDLDRKSSAKCLGVSQENLRYMPVLRRKSSGHETTPASV